STSCAVSPFALPRVREANASWNALSSSRDTFEGRFARREQSLDRGVDRADDLDLAAVVAIVIRDNADVDDACFGGPIAIEFDRVEADHEHEVACVDEVIQVGRTETFDRADEERMVFAEDALRLRAHHHRYLPGLGETPEWPRDGIVVGVHSHEKERTLAVVKASRRGTDRVVVDRRHVLGREARKRYVDGLLFWDVARHLEVDRTAASARGHP